MSETSAILGLPYLMPAQAQKHVTHNQALQTLDALVQLCVTRFDAETPPQDPAPGDSYALGAVPSGSWAGQGQSLAIWQGEGWLFLAPRPGWRAWSQEAGELRIWQGSSWARLQGETQNLPQIGVQTNADASNRLAVASEASLFTHMGSGHQLKLNKASSGDTAALLLQSNWGGRAEIGLLGNDDLSFKTSADGSSWTTALALKPGGHAGLGTSSPTAHLEIAGSGSDYLLAGDGSGAVFRLGADGTGACDGAWSGGGADYAEWFEWADGNPDHADRRGLSVVLAGAKIRPARPGEDPIGVISAAPAVIGDGDLDEWKQRWLRDDYGTLLRDAAGRRLQNPDYDARRSYQPRAARPEWALVGLLGKLRLRLHQPTSPCWQPLRRISDRVEEWLIR